MLSKKIGSILFSGLMIFQLSCQLKSNNNNVVIVQINEQKITAKEFAELLHDELKPYDILSGRDGRFIEQAKKTIIQNSIYNYLIQRWAQNKNIYISKTDLENEVKNVRENYPDDIAFRASLAAEGISFDVWIRKMKLRLLTLKVVEDITKDVQQPTNTELEQYYKLHKDSFKLKEMAHLKHVLTEKKIEAERLRKALKSGQSIEELAKKFSIAPDASKEGDLGWIELGTMDVFDEAFKIPINSISRVSKSIYGYHVIKLIKKRPARQQQFSEVKDKILKEIFEDRKQATYTSWVDKQSKSIKLLINEDALKAIKVQAQVK